jgi:hypothetical protein
VPGRKTDFSGAGWLAHLLECGLLAGSFMPPAEIKAARDLIRYRTKVAQQRVSEIARLGNVLQDAGIKTGLSGLLHRHQVRPGDDRGADRRGTPRPALEAFAGQWEGRYPAIVKLWRAHWNEFTPFLALPPEVRRVIYTTKHRVDERPAAQGHP